MAVPAAILSILIDANTRPAQAGLLRVQGQAEATNRKFTALRAGSGLLGVAIAGGLAAAFHTGWQEMKQAEIVGAQTNTVLRSTGGVARVTAGHVADLAQEIMKKSGFDDEAVQSGENLLLTFTKIRNEAGQGNDIFDQTTSAAADMAAAFTAAGKSMSISDAALQLGKALNDPAKGMSRLQRVGVSFTEGQKKAVAQMVATGDTMGAQKLILKELNTEFGGSAETMGKTLPGQMNILKETFNNLAGSVVQAVIPAMTALIGPMTTIASFLAAHETLTKVLVIALAGLATVLGAVAIGTRVAAAMQVIWTAATTAAEAITYGLVVAQWALNAAFAANPIGVVVIALLALAAVFYVAYQKIGPFREAVDAFWGLLQDAFGWIKDNWPLLLAILTGPIGLAVLLIVKHADDIVALFRSLPGMIADGFTAAAGLISSAIMAPVNLVVSLVKGALGSAGLGGWLVALWGGVKTAADTAWALIQSAVTAPVHAVVSIIHDALGADGLRGWLTSLWGGIQVAAGTGWDLIKAAVMTPIDAAVSAVKAALGEEGLRGWLAKVWAGIETTATSAGSGILNAITLPYRSGAKAIADFAGFILKVIDKIPGIDLKGPIAAVEGFKGDIDAIKLARGGITPVGAFGKGGLINNPMLVVGEEAPRHPEFVIPTNPAYRDRAMGLYGQLGKQLGVPGFVLGGVFGKGLDIAKGAIGGAEDLASSGIDLISKGPGALIDLLPDPSEVLPRWLNKTGDWVVSKAADFIRDKIKSVVSAVVGPISGLFSGGDGGDRIGAMVTAMDLISAHNFPYSYGGGHNGSFQPSADIRGTGAFGYDCSGLVSAILHAGGFPGGVMSTDQLWGWGEPGMGKAVTVGVRGSTGLNAHTMMKIGGAYLESGSGHGAQWVPGWSGAFDVYRHPPGFAKGGVLGDAAEKWLDPARVGWGLASGGTVSKGGWVKVGENGPEMAHLPSGTRVFDNATSNSMMNGRSDGPLVHIENATFTSELEAESFGQTLAWRILNSNYGAT